MEQFRRELRPLSTTTALADLQRTLEAAKPLDTGALMREAVASAKAFDVASIAKQTQLDVRALDTGKMLRELARNVKPLDTGRIIDESLRTLRAYDTRDLIAEAQRSLGTIDFSSLAKAGQLAFAASLAEAVPVPHPDVFVEEPEEDPDTTVEELFRLPLVLLLKMLNGALISLQAAVVSVELSTSVEVPDAVEAMIVNLIALVTVLTLVAERRSSGP